MLHGLYLLCNMCPILNETSHICKLRVRSVNGYWMINLYWQVRVCIGKIEVRIIHVFTTQTVSLKKFTNRSAIYFGVNIFPLRIINVRINTVSPGTDAFLLHAYFRVIFSTNCVSLTT